MISLEFNGTKPDFFQLTEATANGQNLLHVLKNAAVVPKLGCVRAQTLFPIILVKTAHDLEYPWKQ